MSANVAIPDALAPALSLPRLIRSSAKQTRELFSADFAGPSGLDEPQEPQHYAYPRDSLPTLPIDAVDRTNLSVRIRSEYSDTQELPPSLAAKQQAAAATATARRKRQKVQAADEKASEDRTSRLIEQGSVHKTDLKASEAQKALIRHQDGAQSSHASTRFSASQEHSRSGSSALMKREVMRQVKPDWQPPWKLMRVISGHLGWVRALAVEPDNQWFASGAGDRTIKIWDLASGHLKLTLTGHISTVRGLAVSPRHPYLFSCAEDKKVKCWDLETNKVIRDYHGHLSGVYTLALHPTLDVLMTGGRDGVVRVWDMRTRQNVHVLSGHKGTISSVITQATDPQVISGSLDSTVRLWDLAAGKSMGVLTHHKKGVRALAQHPKEWTFASGSTSSIKQWKCPEGALMQNFEGHNAIINTLAVNEDDVLVSGGDDGSMSFWDWKTGHRFQNSASVAQPGSLDAEAGFMSMTFDQTGLRLLTGEADKTIKVWRQDENATEESHPLQWTPTLGRRHY